MRQLVHHVPDHCFTVLLGLRHGSVRPKAFAGPIHHYGYLAALIDHKQAANKVVVLQLSKDRHFPLDLQNVQNKMHGRQRCYALFL